MTITIELDEALTHKVAERAAAAGVSDAEFVRRAVAAAVEPDGTGDAAFRAAAAATFAEHAELYRRLAK